MNVRDGFARIKFCDALMSTFVTEKIQVITGVIHLSKIPKTNAKAKIVKIMIMEQEKLMYTRPFLTKQCKAPYIFISLALAKSL